MQIEQKRLSTVVEGEQQSRQLDRSEPDNIAEALFEYVKYGERSSYLTRLSMKEIQNLKTSELADLLHQTLNYEAKIFYSGKKDASAISALADKYLKFSDKPIRNDVLQEKQIKNYTQNEVFFVNKSKAQQSKVFILMNGKTFNPSEVPVVKAYNLYFGGGFSGLVLQEIREYRSMAYTAAARYQLPRKATFKTAFVGYIGTQADKTNGALKIFNDLVRNMPEKSERMDMIRQFLRQTALSTAPSFRELPKRVESWKNLGYSEDPRRSTDADKVNFSDIVDFYNKNIKNKPMVIIVVGDKKQIDMDDLKKYGKLTIVKEDDLFR